MIELETSRSIACPPDRVFDVLVDFEHCLAQWAAGPTAATRIRGDGSAGSEYLVEARIGPFRVRSPYRVTESERPDRFAGSGAAGPVRFDEAYTIEPEGSGCTLRYTTSARPRRPFGPLGLVIAGRLRRLIGADLDRLKALVEGPA